MTDIPLDLSRLFTQNQPEALAQYLFVPSDRPLIPGSTVPSIAATAAVRKSGLVVPSTARETQPIDFIYTFVTADDYLPAIDPEIVEPLISQYVANGPFRSVATSLAVMNHFAGLAEPPVEITDAYLSILKPDPRARLASALASDSPPRRLLARQCALRSIRFAIEMADDRGGDDSFEWPQAVLICHLTAQALGEDDHADSDGVYGTFPSNLALSYSRNELFNRTEPTLSLFARTRLLWSDNEVSESYGLRDTPSGLVIEATGLSPTEWLAFGLAVVAHRTSNPPTGAMWMPETYFSGADEEKREAFLSHVAATQAEFADAFDGLDSSWGFVPFERTPLLRIDSDYLLIDEQFLVDRVTTGLYWLVFDHERAIGSAERKAWTRAFGKMFEEYVIDIARRLAPPLLDGSPTFYAEEELLQIADAKSCDCAIDFGQDMVLVEVVGGRLTLRSRVEGDPEALKDETRRLVFEKAEQLDSTIKTLLRDESALTSHTTPEGRRYQPVVVNVGSYPVNPITSSVIEDHIEEQGWFDDPRVAPLCVIDVGEMEIVEAMSEFGGKTLPEILADWKSSDLLGVSLRNYIYDRTPGASANAFRSSTLMAAWDEIADSAIEVLIPNEGVDRLGSAP